MSNVFYWTTSPNTTLFDLEESFSMVSSSHLSEHLVIFFQLLEGLSYYAIEDNQPVFSNTRGMIGFVGNSYKVVNASYEKPQLFGLFTFSSFLKNNPTQLSLFITGWPGPAPVTDQPSSCEVQQTAKRQHNKHDFTSYFDHAKALEGPVGKYRCCKTKVIEY